MIVRVWHGETPTEKADAYLDYLHLTGVPGYTAVEGNRGVQIWRSIQGSKADFVVVSYWDSFEAIQAFAGPHFEKAVYYPEDKDYLLGFEPEVMHYELKHSELHMTE